MRHPTPISVLFQDTNDIIKITPLLHMRLRPHMYLGAVDARGIVQLMDDVLALLLTTAQDKSCTIAITMRPRGRFVIQFQGAGDWLAAVRQIEPHHHFAFTYILQVVRALSTKLQVQYGGREYLFSPFGEWQPWMQIADAGTGFLRMEFSLDHTIFSSLELDWEAFLERIHILAMLHPHAHFSVENELHALPSVQQFHAPHGIIHLYKQTKMKLGAHTICELHFRGVAKGYPMDICIGLADASGSGQRMRTFANSIETLDGGSLADGIVAGLARALDLQERKQVTALRKCVVACAVVLGADFQFLHPTRRCLHVPAVRRAASEVVAGLLRERLKADAALREALIQLVGKSLS